MNCKLVCVFVDFVLKVDWLMCLVIVYIFKLLYVIINMYFCLKINFYIGLYSVLFFFMCLG